MGDVLETHGLTYVYTEEGERQGQESVPALQHFDLRVQQGEFITIIGHNGSGKSTLAKLLNALLLPTEGQVLVHSHLDTSNPEHLWEVRRQAGMVFQNPDNQLIGTTVEEDVAFGLENLGLPHDEMFKRIETALSWVGMLDNKDAEPHRLSGGQKQLVAIAGILAMQPSVILLDEATTMLDPQGRQRVLGILHRLNREMGMTMLHITHHLQEAVAADRVIVMNEGQLYLQGTPEQIFSQAEALQEIGLEVPFSVALADRLRRQGWALPQNILTQEQLVDELCRYWSKD